MEKMLIAISIISVKPAKVRSKAQSLEGSSPLVSIRMDISKKAEKRIDKKKMNINN